MRVIAVNYIGRRSDCRLEPLGRRPQPDYDSGGQQNARKEHEQPHTVKKGEGQVVRAYNHGVRRIEPLNPVQRSRTDHRQEQRNDKRNLYCQFAQRIPGRKRGRPARCLMTNTTPRLNRIKDLGDQYLLERNNDGY